MEPVHVTGNEHRFLLSIARGNSSPSDIANDVSEASAHVFQYLTKLRNKKLISKDPTALYGIHYILTPLGEISMKNRIKELISELQDAQALHCPGCLSTQFVHKGDCPEIYKELDHVPFDRSPTRRS